MRFTANEKFNVSPRWSIFDSTGQSEVRSYIITPKVRNGYEINEKEHLAIQLNLPINIYTDYQSEIITQLHNNIT